MRNSFKIRVMSEPTTLAYYSVVGCHEEDYYPKLMIRRAAAFGRPTFITSSAEGQIVTDRQSGRVTTHKIGYSAGKESGLSGLSGPTLPLSKISARKQRGKPSQAGAGTPPSPKRSAPVPQIQTKGQSA